MGDLPTFRLYRMSKIEKDIKKLLDRDIYLIDVQENHNNDLLKIIVDSEADISIDRIAEITRKIRDAKIIDNYYPSGYKMEVSTIGVGTNLEYPFQFRKNIGRKLKLNFETKDSTKSVKASLKDVNETGIYILMNDEIRHINYRNIKQAQVMVSFN